MVERPGMSAAISLEELLAEDAIIDVLARYSRTLDWLDDAGKLPAIGPMLRSITASSRAPRPISCPW